MWPLGLHACNDVVLLADKAAGSDSQSQSNVSHKFRASQYCVPACCSTHNIPLIHIGYMTIDPLMCTDLCFKARL